MSPLVLICNVQGGRATVTDANTWETLSLPLTANTYISLITASATLNQYTGSFVNSVNDLRVCASKAGSTLRWLGFFK